MLTGLADAAADMVRTRGRGLKNALAQRSDQRIVVFESDDWGSQRVPSKAARDRLLAQGILSGKSAYDQETLENAEDVATLCEVLGSVRDADGLPAVFSCFVNPANPDFDRIRESDFEGYFWEPTSQTLERRGDRAAVQAAWQSGRAAGLVDLEYHGREHLQVRLWMDFLRSSSVVRAGFELGYYSVACEPVPPTIRGFRAAYFFESPDEIPAMERIVVDGARLFEEEYGVRPHVFCAPNNVFHPELYRAVKTAGCNVIVRHARNLQPDGRGGVTQVWGNRRVREAGLSWYGRNAIFEPEQGYGIEHALRGIRSAFAWGVPAIVSTHRVNYVGGIDPRVRDRGARELGALLKAITKTWPDVHFMSSRALAKHLGWCDG